MSEQAINIQENLSITSLMTYEEIREAVESVDGFLIPGQEEYLFNKVRSLSNDAVIVEIGSFRGRSTVAIGYACLGTRRKIYCIDTWRKTTWEGHSNDCPEEDFFPIWQQNIEKNGLGEYVIPLRGYSHEILSQWCEIVGQIPIDFIFIDGSHEYHNVVKDFELSFPLVSMGGWMAFHDVTPEWSGSERAWHEVARLSLNHHEYCSSIACGQKTVEFQSEKAEQLLVKQLVQPGITVFDVGANIGEYTVLFSQLVGEEGKVYAFEPASTTFKTLKRRLESYQCQNVIPLKQAVFSNNGNVELNEFPDQYSGWNTIGHPEMDDPENPSQKVSIVKTEIVKTITLDAFCQEQGIEQIGYLKVDVEGAEKDVLSGAVHLLSKKAIDFIQFEVSQNMLNGLNRTAKDVFEILIQHGYQCHRIQADGELGEEVADSSAFYENYIAFPILSAQIKAILGNLPSKLQYTRGQLQNTKDIYNQTQVRLQQTNKQLQQAEQTLEQTLSLLKKTEDQRVSVQTELYVLQEKLAEEQANHCKTFEQLGDARSQFEQTFKQLGDARSQFEQTQALLQTTQQQLQSTEEKLQNKQQRFDRRVSELKGKLDDLRQELEAKQNEIEAMKSSKFWKLREKWISLKQRIKI
ncbi:MAG TPA: FkbM family methyltransferase [Trichocoleus sp.]|jgi:FkbM family methyltransferase